MRLRMGRFDRPQWEVHLMDGQRCDRHPEAWARARLTLPSGGVLYLCGHCANTLDYDGEFTIQYDTATV